MAETEFLATVCTAAIAVALFRMLVPESKAAKQVSLLTAAVFMLTMLTSAAGAQIDLGALSPAAQEYTDMSEGVNRELQKRVCSQMEERVSALLHEKGYYPSQIHIIVNISGLYSISITQVRLVFAPQNAADAESARAYLAGELAGIDVTAVVKE